VTLNVAVFGDTANLYMDAPHSGQLAMRTTRDFSEAEESIAWQYEGRHAQFSRAAPGKTLSKTASGIA
jgi:hypothetical protein